jgi:hypothetical protein
MRLLKIHILAELERCYGRGRWRKLKGTAFQGLEATGMTEYLICIDNEGYEDDLSLFKVYRVASPHPGDALVTAGTAVRIYDNTGEEYLFEASRFVPIELPAAVQDVFAAAAQLPV